jgi:carbon monoxide dehydrogenase subunit G
VDAPIERVWAALLDVERVAPTVPGAQVLERIGDDAYKVAIKVKVGPMSMTYRGEVEITERDDAAHRAVMKARAKESRGQGMADADVTMVLSGDDGRTAATVTTDVELSGKVATMGQGVLQDVSGRLVQTFANNLAAMLEAEGAAQATADAGAATGAGSAATEAPAATGVGSSATEAPAATGDASSATEPPATGDSSTAGASAPSPAATQTARPSPSTAGGPAGTTVQAKTAAELASTGAAARAPAGGSAAGHEGRSSRPASAPRDDDALDLGSIGGAVIAERLQDPRRLAGLVAAIALISFFLGRRSRG